VKLKLSNALFLLLVFGASLAQADPYKPYVLANTAPAAEVKAKLTAAGFVVVGEYKPYDGAEVIVVTSDALKTEAAKSDRGGYGAVMRVAISTKNDGGTQVSYTNPAYWANGYRMKNELGDVAATLKKALGFDKTFGSEDGLTKKKLRKYEYIRWVMPNFTDQVDLATYPSHKKAVKAIEANLNADKGNTTFVYRVDIPGKDQTVFGMGLKGEHDGADKKAMATLSKFTGDPKHTAYMPYEILVSGKKVEMLHGKFRIALSFPDLTMSQFLDIRNAPDGIEKAAKAVAKAAEK
jgi:hypothetical protein